MVLSNLAKKEKLAIKDKMKLFDQSVTEYRYILRHFWHECVVKLLNFKADDLNKISLFLYSYEDTKTLDIVVVLILAIFGKIM